VTGRSTARAAEEARDTAALLMHVTEQTRQSFEAVAARFELTTAQARALLALETDAPMRALAEHLRCDASNVTGIADRLQDRGLVARVPSVTDRRVKLLALTDAGRELRAALRAAMLEASPVMVSLDADERAALRALLATASNAPATEPHTPTPTPPAMLQ
jgi:DNA-binding MarR family transcriptional regulator